MFEALNLPAWKSKLDIFSLDRSTKLAWLILYFLQLHLLTFPNLVNDFDLSYGTSAVLSNLFFCDSFISSNTFASIETLMYWLWVHLCLTKTHPTERKLIAEMLHHHRWFSSSHFKNLHKLLVAHFVTLKDCQDMSQ